VLAGQLSASRLFFCPATGNKRMNLYDFGGISLVQAGITIE
jgi:hypothetical protein